MSIKIEQLDDECRNREITTLVGRNFLLKFIPGKCVLDSHKSLQDLIKTTNLLSSSLIHDIKKIVKLSNDISATSGYLSQSVRLQDWFKKINRKEEAPSYFDFFDKIKHKIISTGEQISRIEKEIGLYLAKDHNLYFCSKCHTYLTDSPESLPINCRCCDQSTDWGKSNEIVRFLEGDVTNYLDGIWLEDYIAKLFRGMGWKTWCHGETMGSSGIDYPIDILAINLADGRVLVGECKSGGIPAKDIFNFSAQYFDIKSNYGFVFSLKEVLEPRLKEYMNRTPGLCLLDNLENLPDKSIIEKIEKNLRIL